MTSYLVTGGCGFVGSCFVNQLLRDGGCAVVNVDALTYCASEANVDAGLAARAGARYRLVRADINDTDAMLALLREHRVDVVVNFAAESHVDNSIADPAAFVRANVDGVCSLLRAAMRCRDGPGPLFHQVSTDEVYGQLPLDAPGCAEDSALAPRSPYAASKAAADMLVAAFGATYQLPYLITRSCNNFGPRQHHEKLIPKAVRRYLAGEPIPVYGDGRHVRDWIDVELHCRVLRRLHALWRSDAWRHRVSCQVFNISAGAEVPNIELVERVQALLNGRLGLDRRLVAHVADRPGHDRRYSVDCSKLAALLADASPELAAALRAGPAHLWDGLAACVASYLE